MNLIGLHGFGVGFCVAAALWAFAGFSHVALGLLALGVAFIASSDFWRSQR